MSKVIDYINKTFSLQEEYIRIFGKPLPNGKFLCPNPMHMHKNNTPSCKVYGNVFKCFGQCNRVFGVYDLLRWYAPERIQEIKSTVLVPEEPRQVKNIQKVSVDRDLPIGEILKIITGIDVKVQGYRVN